MSYFFTTTAKTLLTSTPTAFQTVPIRVILFRSAPSMSPDAAAPWSGVSTKAQLLSYPGWEEVTGIPGYPFATTLGNLVLRPSAQPGTGIFLNTNYYVFDEYAFTHATPVGVAAIGFERASDGMLIFVTNSPTGSLINIGNGDKLVAASDTSFPDTTNRWLMQWAVNPTRVDPEEGPLMVLPAAPTFELSNALHVWLYPQRANMIANPSFEYDASYWQPPPVRQNDPAPGGGAWSGKFSTPDSSVRSTGVGITIRGADIAALAGAKKVRIEADVALDDWTPAVQPEILAQWGAGPSRCLQLAVSTVGRHTFNASTNGTANLIFSGPIPAPEYAGGSRHTIGGVYIADTGTASTYQPYVDGVAQGPVISQASYPNGLFDSALPIDIGTGLIGNVYGLKIWVNDVLVANPDFTNMVNAQTSVVDDFLQSWALQGTATVANPTFAAPLAIESNVWPTIFGSEQSELWTLQLRAKGKGNVKLGLVFWDADYRGTGCDWGTETWELSEDAWIQMACVRQAPQAHQACLRIEVDGKRITIDKVLAERGALKEHPYFDGDETYSAPGAYSWYGGESMAGISYSMWYSGRRAVMGRLFAAPDDKDGLITDDEIRAAGAVYNWVPAGVSVVPHIDVFYPGDLRNPPPPKTKPPLPYYDVNNPMGVSYPWSGTVPTKFFRSAVIQSLWGRWIPNANGTITLGKGMSISTVWPTWDARATATVVHV